MGSVSEDKFLGEVRSSLIVNCQHSEIVRGVLTNYKVIFVYLNDRLNLIPVQVRENRIFISVCTLNRQKMKLVASKL